MPILLGCIADDFTGATDLANTLVKQGMPTLQTIGVPGDEIDLGDAKVVVIALKSRTLPAGEAVAQSLSALLWLRNAGAEQIFFKYCSTFDSTPKGNIGPVADALMNALGAAIAIACPAFPTNGRTIYQGHLFVGDQLLSESGMKDHPLTPMRDSSLVRLLQQQSTGAVGLVAYPTIARGPAAIAEAIAALQGADHRYAIVDALTDQDLFAIGRACAGMKLITGGSGVALGLPDNFRRAGRLADSVRPERPAISGARAVLAGSCSLATRSQIAHVREIWPCYRVDPAAIAAGRDIVAEALAFAQANRGTTPVLIYSSDTPEAVLAAQSAYGREEAGALVEQNLAAIAKGLVGQGVRQLIVAGGETSGAVVAALGIAALEIGDEIDPGVPWTTARNRGDTPVMALALKSGNFGSPDFFAKAFAMLAEQN